MLVIQLSNVMQGLDINTKQLVGEVLTLLEMAMPDDTKERAALKAMVKRAIWRKNQDLQDVLNGFASKSEDLK